MSALRFCTQLSRRDLNRFIAAYICVMSRFVPLLLLITVAFANDRSEDAKSEIEKLLGPDLLQVLILFCLFSNFYSEFDQQLGGAEGLSKIAELVKEKDYGGGLGIQEMIQNLKLDGGALKNMLGGVDLESTMARIKAEGGIDKALSEMLKQVIFVNLLHFFNL